MRYGVPKPLPLAQDVFVVRANFDPAALSLHPAGPVFINRLQNKDRFGDALEQAQHEHTAFDLSGVLSMCKLTMRKPPVSLLHIKMITTINNIICTKMQNADEILPVLA